MSHHDQNFLQAPRKLYFGHGKRNETPHVELIVKGQGALSFTRPEKTRFPVIRIDNPDKRAEIQAIRLEIMPAETVFSENRHGKWIQVSSAKGGVQKDTSWIYWFSLDTHNRVLRYGKGEMRLNTKLAEYQLPPVPEKGTDPYAWISEVSSFIFEHPLNPVKLLRDPVTIDPPLAVIPVDKITMDDVALTRATVAANLTPTCQQLYYTVSGESFKLDTPDFPDFSKAIEYSISNPDGWCYKTLQEKSGEFGKKNIEATYLRITLGVNQGDSPGIPYVMEIWPPGHFSPVHNHAGANAVIRVLHGAIQVSLFSQLSENELTPFMQPEFKEGDVTWISPELNQTHQLHNIHKDGPTCITIQCYMYSDTDHTHYGYFDYIADGKKEIQHFEPNSDMGYLQFKALMRKEWDARPAKKAAAHLQDAK